MSIRKYHIIGISLTILSAISLVALLAWRTMAPISQKNGFSRLFMDDKLIISNSIEKNADIINVCGETEYSIYFKTRNPGRLYVTNKNLEDGKYIDINIPSNSKIASAFNIAIDSPIVHIMAGNGPAIITTDLNSKNYAAFNFPTAVFTRSVKVSNSSYIFRGFDTTIKSMRQIFIKGNPSLGEIKRENNLNAEKDLAGITTDGSLSFDEKSKMLTFVSFYRNKFSCFDTSLNLIFSGKTIDTINNYQISAESVDDGNKKSITSAKPLRVINAKSHVFNGKLFNASRLVADNENEEASFASSVIDIYDLEAKGKYQGSFYIPLYKREKLLDFKMFDDRVIGVYKSKIISYKLDKKTF